LFAEGYTQPLRKMSLGHSMCNRVFKKAPVTSEKKMSLGNSRYDIVFRKIPVTSEKKCHQVILGVMVFSERYT
jgi:hypothetical protein